MKLFPRLKANNFRITSGRTALYNCIAWAAGRNDDWWEWRKGYAWPNAPRNDTVAAAVALFESLGFEKCGSSEWQADREKVAIYGDQQGYTHAARQLGSGLWSSKIGKLEDIEHKSLDDLIDGDYGQVVQILGREKNVLG